MKKFCEKGNNEMKTMLRIETDFGFMSDPEKGFSFDGGETWAPSVSKEDIRDCMNSFAEGHSKPLNKEGLAEAQKRLELLLKI